MNNYGFYEVLLNNQFLYIELLIFSIILHYVLFRKFIITLFDPHLLPLITSVFCVTTVVFLFITGDIRLFTFLSFVLSQAAFWMGLFFFKPVKYFVKRKLDNNQAQDTPEVANRKHNYKVILFYTSTFILLLSQSAVYLLKGIPLLMESRLETFAGSKGAGVLGRITDVTAVCSLYTFFSITRFDFPRKSELFRYFLLSLIFATFILSGSKSSFLIIISTFWAYIIFNILKGGDYKNHLNTLKSNIKLIIAICFIVVLGIIYVQMSSQPNSSLFWLALRFIHSGDVFWYSYPNDIYLIIDDRHPFQALFTDALGMFRIYQWDELPEVIGITLKDYHHPSNIPQGPNARHNIFGLVYFGMAGGIIFSFSLGLIFSFIRNILPRLLKNNVVSGVIFAYLVIRLPALEADPMLGFTSLNNLLFVFPFLLTGMLIVNGIILRKF